MFVGAGICDSALEWEVQWTGDSGGVPDTGSAVTIQTVGVGKGAVVALFPLDGTLRYFRTRHVGRGFSPGVYSQWSEVSTPQMLPDDLDDSYDGFTTTREAPTVDVTSTAEGATTETFTITATASAGGSSNLEVRSRARVAGSNWGAFSAWVASPQTGVLVTRHALRWSQIQVFARDVDRGNVESAPMTAGVQPTLTFFEEDGDPVRSRVWDDGDWAVRSPANTGRQIENVTRIVDGSGNFVPNRHTESGLNKDGDSISFALAFEEPPSMWFVPQVGLSYRSADTAADQVLDMAAESLTVTGFNLRAKIISGATATAVVDGFSAAQNTASPENGTVSLSAEGDVAYSNLEDANATSTTYNVFYDIDATSIGTNLVTVEVYTNSSAGGTTWTLRSSRTYDNLTNLTDEKQSFTVALGADYDIRLRITYFSPPGGSTATVTALGEDSTPEEGVQYDKVTGGTALSMTPNTGDKIRWTGQEASS